MLKVESVSKRFLSGGSRTHVPALNEVSIDVPEGQFFTLLGPSGCGKTTLLRCVAGLETPDRGRITIGGREVYHRAEGRAHLVAAEERPIGMVFQSYAIWPHMSVFENAAYPLVHGRARVPRKQVPDLVCQMLETVGLEEYGDRMATALSGGQQQRLALARALLARPKLLLLDEPLSNLDTKLRTSLRAELKALQRETGVTTLYVTHDQHEALAMSDTIAVMEKGEVAQQGTPNEVYESPASLFVADFVGESNRLTATISPGAHAAECGFGALEITPAPAHPEGPVWLCIRPEDVEVKSLTDTDADRGVNAFSARVMRAEYLGDCVRVTLDLNGGELLAQVGREVSVNDDDRVSVHLPAERIRIIADLGRNGHD